MTKLGRHLERLIRRMERAPDFGYDDEGAELQKRLSLNGLTWEWDKNNKIIIKEKIK